MSGVLVGTCGFCLPQAEFFRTFRLVEIQQTFYQPPQARTVERWRRQAPDQFVFTLKAFQAITHRGSSPTYKRCRLSEAERAECGDFRDTPTVRAAWHTTLELARLLHAACVVFQCPASFRPTDENVSNLRRFFGWAARDGLTFCWEPRGAEWTDALVRSLCNELDLVHVVDPLYAEPVTGGTVYFRLHGRVDQRGRIVYSHRYSDDELRRVAGECRRRSGYCLLNNSNMREDALRLQRLLQGER